MVMTYRVEIAKPAARNLRRIHRTDRARIMQAIESLADDPRPAGTKNLQGMSGYRIRVGNYRIIYHVDDTVRVVAVTRVAHRREVYQ